MVAPRALVVEDDTFIALMIEDILTTAGCEVAFTAASLPDAMPIAREEPIDLAFLDLRLAGGELSIAIADELEKRGIPFGFVTAEGRCGLGGRFPAAPVVQKPFRAEDIQALLGELVASRRRPAPSRIPAHPR